MKTKVVTKTDTYDINICDICESEKIKITVDMPGDYYPEGDSCEHYHFCSLECLRAGREMILAEFADVKDDFDKGYFNSDLEIESDDPKIIEEMLDLLTSKE